MCYDRLQAGMEPACAKACPTQSIQFGPISQMKAKAQARLAQLRTQGLDAPQLYGADDSIYGGLNSFFLLMREPEAYGLPNARNAVLPRRNNARGYLGALATAFVAVIAGMMAFRRRPEGEPPPRATEVA
jgi:formate dehydrogenase iron-sulfur subunit